MAQFTLYSTRGDWAGLLIDGYVYNRQGEWVGWLEKDGQMFAVTGEYVGYISKDFRLLRKRVIDETLPRRRPPKTPPLKIRMPAHAPLPPMMAELSYDTIDVFDDMPERLHPADYDPNAQDID